MALRWPVMPGMRAWPRLGQWRSAWREPAWVCLVPAVDAASSPTGVPVHDQALLQWRQWCEAHPGQRVRLGLSARWLLSAVVPTAGRGAAARREAMGEAESRWTHLLGLDDSTWQDRWVTRAVALPQGMLVCAVPRALVDDVLAVAAHHHVALQWIGPWWAHGLLHWMSIGHAAPAASRAHLQDVAAQTLLMREPGWQMHAQVQGGQLVHLWAEPDAGEGTSPGAQASCVSLLAGLAGRTGAGTVWHEPALAPTLSGQSSVWGGRP